MLVTRLTGPPIYWVSTRTLPITIVNGVKQFVPDDRYWQVNRCRFSRPTIYRTHKPIVFSNSFIIPHTKSILIFRDNSIVPIGMHRKHDRYHAILSITLIDVVFFSSFDFCATHLFMVAVREWTNKHGKSTTKTTAFDPVTAFCLQLNAYKTMQTKCFCVCFSRFHCNTFCARWQWCENSTNWIVC